MVLFCLILVFIVIQVRLSLANKERLDLIIIIIIIISGSPTPSSHTVGNSHQSSLTTTGSSLHRHGKRHILHWCCINIRVAVSLLIFHYDCTSIQWPLTMANSPSYFHVSRSFKVKSHCVSRKLRNNFSQVHIHALFLHFTTNNLLIRFIATVLCSQGHYCR